MTLISREILQRVLRWSKKRKILTSLFAVYIFAVLWLTLLDRQWGERQAELMPFWEVRNLLENISIKYLRDFWLVQIFGNIAMFIPLGDWLRTSRSGVRVPSGAPIIFDTHKGKSTGYKNVDFPQQVSLSILAEHI